MEVLWMSLSKPPQIFGETCPWCSFWWRSSVGVDASLLARPPPPTGGGQPCTSSAAPTSHSMLLQATAATYCKQLKQATVNNCMLLQFECSAEVQLVQQTSASVASFKCCKCFLLGSVQVFPPGLASVAIVASVASVPSWAVCKCSLLDLQVLQVLQVFPPGEASHSIFCLTFQQCTGFLGRSQNCTLHMYVH